MCIDKQEGWPYGIQMVTFTEKLTNLKYELLMVYLDRDIQFLSYALIEYRSMIIYELFTSTFNIIIRFCLEVSFQNLDEFYWQHLRFSRYDFFWSLIVLNRTYIECISNEKTSFYITPARAARLEKISSTEINRVLDTHKSVDGRLFYSVHLWTD